MAQAFPYCQTAHLLLAKAAHDQGSMLAGQRLRRAATYAADRQLLRQLLERPAGEDAADLASHRDAGSAASVGGVGAAPAAPTTKARSAALIQPREGSKSEAAAHIKEAISAEASVPIIHPVGPATFPVLAAEPATEAAPTIEVVVRPDLPSDALPEDNAVPLAVEARAEMPFEADPVATEPHPTTGADVPVSPGAEADGEPRPADASADPKADLETRASNSDAAVSPTKVEVSPEAEATPADKPNTDSSPLPIRPSAEAGTARFEFGLSRALENEFAAYQLPDLLAAPAKEPAPSVPELAGPPFFVGSAEISYSLPGGSRLGYALLTVPPADGAGLPWATADAPGAPLPPVAEFFPPDALVLEHLAKQPAPALPAPALPAPSPVDLIDSFLRRAPQRRRGIVTLLTVPEQADLSMRSTQAESGLASESLARILAGQGKLDRAISVYERLMVRQPEKSAYFAVQIELLRKPPTPSS